MSEVILSCRGVSKNYGGFSALRDVSFEVYACEIHALIGPNGAGKTTLLSQICGDGVSEKGALIFCGRDITRLNLCQRVKLGLSRSFQTASLFDKMSVLENMMLAVQAHSRSFFNFWSPVLRDKGLLEQSHALLSTVGLSEFIHMKAGSLSYGEQKKLDIAMALAGNPRLIVLDEPLGGMGGIEAAALVELIDRLAESRAILLVEHDMKAVFALADRISVLIAGRLMATGTPDEIRTNEKVVQVYLGADPNHA